MGSPELAALTAGRHFSIVSLMRWFDYEHLRDPSDRQVSAMFARLAAQMVQTIRRDDPELATALRKLLESKDAAVRANIASRSGPPQPAEL